LSSRARHSRSAPSTVVPLAAIGCGRGSGAARDPPALLAALVAVAPLAPGRSLRLRRQQQRLLADDEPRQGGGDLHRRHVVLLLVLFHQPLQEIQLAGGQGVGDALLEAGNALVVDGLGGRELERLDGLARGALDGAQHAPLARGDEQDGLAGAPGAAGAADAVDVGLGVVGDVVVDDMADALDVEPAGGDVGGDDDVELAALQPLDDLLAELLRQVAVERRGGVAAGLQALGQLGGGGLGAHEDQQRIEGLHLQDAGQGVELVQPAHQPPALADGLRRCGARLDADLDGIVEVGLGDALDGAAAGSPRTARSGDPAGVCSRIHSTSSMKPMRSISSASSSTSMLAGVQHPGCRGACGP
jgi:hypothetical protein